MGCFFLGARIVEDLEGVEYLKIQHKVRLNPMKKKWLINVFALIIFLGVIIYFNYQNYRLGEREDREELLVAVMFDITEIESISKEDVKEIKVFRQDAGVYPFYFNTLVRLNN